MKMKEYLLTTLALTILSLPATAAEKASDWPTWSGPHHNLTASGGSVFDRPVFGLEVLWKKPLGSGFSGIVVEGERVITAFSDGESDVVIALRADDGEELWRYRIADTHKGREGSLDGPLATPSIQDGRVYGLGGEGELFAIRLADGTEVWKRRLVEDLGGKKPLYGFTSAPTLVDGVLVIQTGGGDGHSVAGLDPKTGETLWTAGDGDVEYQSPVGVTVGGEAQVVAVTNRDLFGLVPRTGEILWKVEHTSLESGGFQMTQPIPVDTSGVLLTGDERSVFYRVSKSKDGYRAEEVWSSRAMYRTLASPVPFEGYLYGFVGQRFLTCVDAATGKTVWKSREPGAGHVLLVDGHLVLLGGSHIVVAKATPEGYREEARVKALQRSSYTRPSFADGRIFVRDTREILSIGVSDKAETVVAEQGNEPKVELRGMMAGLVGRIEAAEDKAAVIDEFLAAHRETPILEGERLVHFVFYGDVDDLVLKGNMEPWDQELSMHRVQGTDFYFRSMELEPDGRFEYNFGVFDEAILDPRNPHHSEIDGRDRSILFTQGFREAANLREVEGERGRVEKLAWKSQAMGDERELRLYLPPGYDESTERYPLLVVYDGEDHDALGRGLMDRTLDNLIGKSVAPLIVAFLPQVHYTESGSRAPDLVRGIDEELLPLLDGRYRTLARPEDRAVMGAGFLGWFAYYLIVDRPDLFTKAATQSPTYGTEYRDRLLESIASCDKAGLKFVVEWTAHEYRDDEGRTPGELLTKALADKGYEPVAHEVPGGRGWGTWRQGTGRILETLFPLK